MKLYEISESLRNVIARGFDVDEETGEILFDESDLEQLKEDFKNKLEACLVVIKEFDAEAEALKNEISALDQRRKSVLSRQEKLKNYVLLNMEQTETSAFETSKVKAKVRQYPHVEVNESQINEWEPRFYSEKVIIRPDKKAIKKALEDGETLASIMSAEIIYDKKLQIS